MALSALSLGDAGMGNIINHPPVVGAVGIVAGITVGSSHRIIHVRCFESQLISLMALFAQGRNFSLQQILCFG
jgi:hypothetical protein